MERTFRKLQKISGSFFVSLPKKWIKNFNLSSKSPIEINVRSDGSLNISPKHEQEDIDLKEELTLHSSPFIAREIVKNCLSGQTNIVVISDKEIDKDLRSEIRWLVNGLPNTEIIEDERQRLVIQNFGYKKIPTKKLIQRLLYLIADMFDSLIEGAIGELNYSLIQLKKFYFILVTHIRTYLRTGLYVTEDNDFTPLEAMDYRMFCEKIQETGKILSELRLNENVQEFFDKIHHYFNDVMNAYLKKDLHLAHSSWLKKVKLVKEAKSLMAKLDFDDKDKIKDMIRIAKNCKDMSALI